MHHQCPRILLAHHADDQAETVLWNLLRGSHGLKGMREDQLLTTQAGIELRLLRPLLQVRHAELVAWLIAHGHRWREDPSNQQPVAVRNRLRHEVIPLLEEIAGRDVVAALVRGAGDAAQQDDLANEAVARACLMDPQGRLHLPELRKLPLDLQRTALRKFLVDHRIPAIDRGLLERAVRLLDITQPAVVNLPGGGRLRRAAGRLWIDA